MLVMGCASGVAEWSATGNEQAEAVGSLTVIRLDASNASAFNPPVSTPGTNAPADLATWDYKIGVGDALIVDVLTTQRASSGVTSSGENSERAAPIVVVGQDGGFQYQLIGRVDAAGRNTEEVRLDIQTRLREFINNPIVEVRVAEFNSQSVGIIGAVSGASRQPITTIRMRMMDAIIASGGLPPDADTQRVNLQRGGRSYDINLDFYLERGMQRSNPTLVDGDLVYIPTIEPREVFMLGEIVTQTSLDIASGPTSLTQALAKMGGIERIRADAKGIFVFRRIADDYTVFQLATDQPSGYMLGSEFLLQENDVVYVTRAPLQAWNDTLRQILPTVTAIPTTQGVANSL